MVPVRKQGKHFQFFPIEYDVSCAFDTYVLHYVEVQSLTNGSGGSYSTLYLLFTLRRDQFAGSPVPTWAQIHHSVLGSPVRSQRCPSGLALPSCPHLTCGTERTLILALGSHQKAQCIVGKVTLSKDS